MAPRDRAAVDRPQSGYFFYDMSNTKPIQTTRMTVKGKVTLPKAVREEAGIRAGDRVVARALPQGGVLIERDADAPENKDFRRRLLAMAKRRPFRGFTTDEVMKLTRGEE